MLLSQHFRVQYDKVDRPLLSAVLRAIPEGRLRQNVALAFLYLHRLIRYLDFIERDLSKDKPLRKLLVIFALLHQESAGLSEFLKSRFLKGKDTGGELARAVELILYSLRLEFQRVMERELVPVAREEDPTTIRSRVQDAHGILRNCAHGGVITLARVFDQSLEARSLFPALNEGAEDSQRLLQELWELRHFLKTALDDSDRVGLSEVIFKVNEFRESSLRTLWYKDWAVFEGFSDALIGAPGTAEVRVTLRKLGTYLEKLVHEISKRRVLQDRQATPPPGQS